MALSKLLTLLAALLGVLAFTSLGGGFRSSIEGVSASRVHASAAAAEGPTAPDVSSTSLAGSNGLPQGLPSAGNADPSAGNADPSAGNADPSAGNADPSSLPGNFGAQGANGPQPRADDLMGMADKIDLGGFLASNNFTGPIVSFVGGIVSGIFAQKLPLAIGKHWLVKALTSIPLLGTKVALFIGAAALIGYSVYDLVKKFAAYAMRNNVDIYPDTGRQGPSGPGLIASQRSSEAMKELMNDLDTDGDGIPFEEEMAAEAETAEVPDIGIPSLDGEEDGAKPAFAAPTTPGSKFAVSLMTGDPSESLTQFRNLLVSYAGADNAKITALAKEILGELAKRGYTGNEFVQQWTEEALMMGYDPRLPLALLAQARSREYATEITSDLDLVMLNDFGGSWNALSDLEDLHDIIAELRDCSSSCAAKMTATGHDMVSGGGPRLSANPQVYSKTMAKNLIDAIDFYLGEDDNAAQDAIEMLQQFAPGN